MGRILGRVIVPGSVIALSGDLGAGKTVFVQGVARGAGVGGIVNSPSYVLMNIYRGKAELYHFDFYRLEEESELFELGLEEYFYGEGITLAEWADKFPALLPPDRLEVVIEKDLGNPDFQRQLSFKPLGGFPVYLLEELERYADVGP